MRFASLISGGKDSCLAHHVVLEHGFEPTAGIVIRPRDADSHMFHVPNLDVAVSQVHALGLELIELEAPAGKETETVVLEDAFEQARELGAETVVAGAVASEYQRVRVERAANATGLEVHTPLWRKDPWRILDPLAGPGYDVRFSRVAAMGMEADWLGRRLDEAALADLRKLHEEHRVHPVGEGGEYESLVLDAPAFEGRIVVEDAETAWEGQRGSWTVHEHRITPDRDA